MSKLLKKVEEGTKMGGRLWFLVAAFSLLPTIAHAQTIQDIVKMIGNVFGRLMPLAIGVALLVFFWGIVRFLASAGNAKARETGRVFMLWGVVALFVMVSVWGIVTIMSQLFGADIGGDVDPPYINL